MKLFFRSSEMVYGVAGIIIEHLRVIQGTRTRRSCFRLRGGAGREEEVVYEGRSGGKALGERGHPGCGG